MCGIAGIFNLDQNQNTDKGLLNFFVKDLSRRGPDEHGIINESGFSFVHTRLSIIDPQHGKQPFKYNNDFLTFNGEIYNYKELNKKLEKQNIPITSNSDTETLLKYLMTFGIDAIKDLDGMFSFAISGNNRLILARDPVGKKPLFYTIKNNALYFASSMSALLPVAGKEIDKTALLNSMLYGNLTFKNRTIYKNIFTVEAGTYVVFRNNGEAPFGNKYWNFVPGDKYYNLSFDAAKEGLRNLLDNAVKKRLISDVPLGAFLSGGLDSTILVSIAKKYKENLRTFSICYDDEVTKENTFADLASKYIKTNHTVITPDFTNYDHLFTELINSKQAPLSTPNEVLIYILAKTAAKELKTVISGEGADELFNGYGAISRAPIDFLRYIHKDNLQFPDKFDNSLQRLYGSSVLTTKSSHFQHFFKRLQNFDLIQIFDSEYDFLDSLYEIDDFFADLFGKYKHLSIYNQYSAVVFNLNLRSLLERLDFNTMHASLEARAPFLDKKIIDFAFNIPLKYKLNLQIREKCLCNYNSYEISTKFDTTKYILREAFRGKVPSETISRKKQSFPVPIALLYEDEKKNAFISQLLNSKDLFFKKESIGEWARDHTNKSSVLKLWSLDNVNRFLGI